MIAGRLRLAILTTAITIGGGCQPPPASPSETVHGQGTYSLCPRSGEPIDAAITQTAVDVLRGRLAYLGVEGAQINLGSCIEVVVPRDFDGVVVAPALQGTGHVSLVPVPPDQAAAVVVGGRPPVDVPALAEDGGFAGARAEPGSRAGSTSLTLELAPEAASVFGAWTSSHIGEPIALVVDGVVVSVPVITEPIPGGRIVLDFHEATATKIPVQAIVAMLRNGPLPDEWAQAQDPQG